MQNAELTTHYSLLTKMDDLEELFKHIRERDAARKLNRKPPYKKPDSVKELERLYFERKQLKNPTIKKEWLIKTKFRDNSSNGLTTCITEWLELHGYFGARVNTTGTYSHKLKKYIYSGSRRGMADITAVVNGKHVSIEIKFGKDRIRPEQIKVKEEIEAAGGIFIIVHTFDEFIEQITNILKQ